MSDSSSGKRCATTIIGLIIIVVGFFGGFMQFFWVDTYDVGTILFYVLVVPMVSALIGMGVILYGMRDSMRHIGLVGLAANRQSTAMPKEKSYVYEPPRFCSDCGAAITSEGIEWVGPLSVKCPYCGATLSTEKREI
jgi:DNA-directed RNA polymerase subunit RPC12/RpoP